MRKSIDTVVPTTKRKLVNFRLHPFTIAELARYALAETEGRGYKVTQPDLVQQALDKDKGFQHHLAAVREAYETKTPDSN